MANWAANSSTRGTPACVRSRADSLPLVRVLERGFVYRFKVPHGGYRVSRSGRWDMLGDVLDPLIRRYQAAKGRPDAEGVREMAT
jgi:hypothetical protein